MYRLYTHLCLLSGLYGCTSLSFQALETAQEQQQEQKQNRLPYKAATPSHPPRSLQWTSVLSQLNNGDSTAAGLGPPVYSPEQDLLALHQMQTQSAKKAWSLSTEGRKCYRTTSDRAKARSRAVHQLVVDRHQQLLTRWTNASRALGQDLTASSETWQERKRILAEIHMQATSHPVASIGQASRYEVLSEVGYCFGRALWVHWAALQRGIPAADIIKVFLVGDLRLGHQFWRFHVATAVRSGPSSWSVIDPMFHTPLSLEEWMGETHGFGIKRQFSWARFYLSDARKFVATPGIYDSATFGQPVLASFFSDLLKSMTEEVGEAVRPNRLADEDSAETFDDE